MQIPRKNLLLALLLCFFWAGTFFAQSASNLTNTLQPHPIDHTLTPTSPSDLSFTEQTVRFQPPQEICGNGLDDDADGLVDFYDPDCANSNSFYGRPVPACNVDLSNATAFSIQLQTTTVPTLPVSVYNTPLSGDIDQDGVVELVIPAATAIRSNPRITRNLLIFNGQTGALERTLLTPYMGWSTAGTVGMADLDGDGATEICLIAADDPANPASDRRHLFCYANNGSLKWRSDVPVGYSVEDFGSAVNFADFNQDGQAEVYVYNQIFNGQTGVLLAQGGPSTNCGIQSPNPNGSTASTFAADMLDFLPGMELVAGNQIFYVDLQNLNGLTGNTMLVATTTTNQQKDGYTALADLDLDGDLDVISTFKDGNTTIRLQAWDGQTGTPLASDIIVSNTSAQSGFPTVGDIDGDCAPEILVVTDSRLTAYELTQNALVQKWDLTTTDGSGATGLTLFDFNQDGKVEVVYRDETDLRILDGNTGNNLATFPCNSGTGWEAPIVVDVDGDNQAEIVATCADSSGISGVLRIYQTAGAPWAPARSIWNQRTYHPVSILDDLSVPRTQQDHSFAVSGGTCGCNGLNRPLNNFMVQATLLSTAGCPLNPVPDMTLNLDSLVCYGTDRVTLFYTVTNSGSAPFPGGGSLTLYAGNPTVTPAPVIRTLTLSQGIAENQSVSGSTQLALNTLSLPLTLFGAINDAGSTPTPFLLQTDFPNTGVAECDYTNNLSSLPFAGCCPANLGLVTQVTDEWCPGAGDGSIALTVSNGTGPYTYLWNDLATGSNRRDLPPGNYQVQVTDSLGCTDSLLAIVAPGVDTTAPLISCPPDFSIQCPDDLPTVNFAGIQALDDCGGVTLSFEGSTDNGGTGCAGDPLILKRTYSATDVNGNTGTCVQQIRREAPLLTLATSGPVVVFPAYPDSACADISTIAMGGCPPYSYAWSNGATTATQTVCPPQSTTYTITVTDANGCSQTDSVRVCTVDLICTGGSNNGQGGNGQGGNGSSQGNGQVHLQFCHIPPGNPAQAMTQCLPLPAVQAHLAQPHGGDYLGACGTLVTRNCSPAGHKTSPLPSQLNLQEIQAFPNPFQHQITFRFSSLASQNVEIHILNLSGQLVRQLTAFSQEPGELEVTWDGTDSSGKVLANGLYLARIHTNTGFHTVKVRLEK